MPKTDNEMMRPKTSPGQSYTVPDTRLIGFDHDEDGANPRIIVALDGLEVALLERAAREVVRATYPRSKADVVLPIGERRGTACMFSAGQFPIVIRDETNKPIDSVAEGATVRFRVMLKAYRAGDRIEVVAFPSRLDVIETAPSLAKESRKPETAQLAMVLEPPPVTKPAKAKKPPKPKAPPKPKTPPPFDKAAYARHRAEVVQARARLRARKAVETAPAVSLGANVILFPISPTKH